MRKPMLNEAKVESIVSAGKVKNLKLSGIHNCCQPCCEAIKEAIESADDVTGDTVIPHRISFADIGDFSGAALVEALHAAGFRAEIEE